MSNTEVRKIFIYDKEEDHDIQEWIESLPSRSHSEFIRKAIRTMIALEKKFQPKGEDIEKLKERMALLEKEMTEIKTYLTTNAKYYSCESEEKNDSHLQKDNNERKFVDASHIIKNLGK